MHDTGAQKRQDGGSTSVTRLPVGPTLSRTAYAGLNAIMVALWLGVMIAQMSNTSSQTDWPLIATFAVGVIWNIVSFARTKVLSLQRLHLAPYLSIAGGYLVLWGLMEGANNGPWVTGYRPSPPGHLPLQIMGLPLLLAWPAGDLYIGPLEFSPAGAPVSLVDATVPDLARFPRFAVAMEVAQTAELMPGDAIYIPYMWWHQVVSLDSFSVLANYWWSETPPPQPGLAPIDVVMYARLAFSAMSPEQRGAVRSLFNHVVFEEGGEVAHLPESRRGIRGKIDETARMRLRRQLGALLSR